MRIFMKENGDEEREKTGEEDWKAKTGKTEKKKNFSNEICLPTEKKRKKVEKVEIGEKRRGQYEAGCAQW